MQTFQSVLEALAILQPYISIFGAAMAVLGVVLFKKAPLPGMQVKSMRVLMAGVLIACLHPAVWVVVQALKFLTEM